MIIFNKEECEYLKSIYHTETEIDAKNIHDYGSVKIKFSNATSKYVLSKNKDLKEFLLKKLQPYGVKLIPDVKFMRYEVGDKLERHTDFSKYGVDIIFKTYLFQISNPDDYEGGDLIVNGNVQSREQGKMTIINPTEPHEVTRIISGERISLVLFLREENLIFNKSII